jgi:tRNA threonylcarbamoyl adenosine modification protein YeaZ
MTHPVLLAIECSQRQGGIALQDRTGRIHERPFETGARRDDVLQPTIESLFADCGLKPEDLDGCGCSIGPGGFTGLRITVATARALGMALDIPLYGIPSAFVAAASSDIDEESVLVALACKGETLWLTRTIRGSDGSWSGAGKLVDLASATESLSDSRVLLADDYCPEMLRAAADHAGLSVAEPVFSATACLHLTSIRHAAGAADDTMGLAPLYPREPEAVTIFNRRQ